MFTNVGEKVTHGPMKKRYDFGRNPDLDPDQEFLKEFYHRGIMVKVSRRGFGSGPKIRRTTD